MAAWPKCSQRSVSRRTHRMWVIQCSSNTIYIWTTCSVGGGVQGSAEYRGWGSWKPKDQVSIWITHVSDYSPLDDALSRLTSKCIVIVILVYCYCIWWCVVKRNMSQWINEIQFVSVSRIWFRYYLYQGITFFH